MQYLPLETYINISYFKNKYILHLSPLFDFPLIAMNFEDGITRPIKCGNGMLKAYFLKGTFHNGYTAGTKIESSPNLNTSNDLSDIC